MNKHGCRDLLPSSPRGFGHTMDTMSQYDYNSLRVLLVFMAVLQEHDNVS